MRKGLDRKSTKSGDDYPCSVVNSFAGPDSAIKPW